MNNYIDKLKADLVDQFKDKKVINALVEAVGEQLNDLYAFFMQLNSERYLELAEGKQLDLIGDVIGLTRSEANQLALQFNPEIEFGDEDYRKYLLYQMWKLANGCTYYDILGTIKMFWDSPVYYSEDEDRPAHFKLTTKYGIADDITAFLNAPLIKAAGVEMALDATFELPLETDLYSGGDIGYCRSVTQMPMIEEVI